MTLEEVRLTILLRAGPPPDAAHVMSTDWYPKFVEARSGFPMDKEGLLLHQFMIWYEERCHDPVP